MGTTYDPNATFLGVGLTAYRDVLRRWVSSQDMTQVTAKKLAVSGQAAAVLVDEAHSAGFFKQPTRDMETILSDSGRGFVHGSPLRPMKRERAKQIVDELLANCAATNTRNDLTFTIDRVWLFGSYISDTPSINDIDIVIESAPIRSRLEDPAWSQRIIDLACELGGTHAVYRQIGYAGNAETWLEKRLTFGPNKNPRLSPTRIDNLKDLACACQLVFDRSRGGPVDDPVLPKHPRAGDRSKRMFAQASMPDLKPAPLLPIQIGLSKQHHCAFFAIESDLVNLSRAAVDGEQKRDQPFDRWLRTLGNVDGKHLSVVSYSPNNNTFRHYSDAPVSAVALTRAFDTEGGSIRYSVSVSDAYLGDKKTMSSEATASVAARIVLAAGCDLEAVSMKTIDVQHPTIVIDVNGVTTGAEEICELVRAELASPSARNPSARSSWLSENFRNRLSAGSLHLDITKALDRTQRPH
jgi:hypothetical protein